MLIFGVSSILEVLSLKIVEVLSVTFKSFKAFFTLLSSFKLPMLTKSLLSVWVYTLGFSTVLFFVTSGSILILLTSGVGAGCIGSATGVTSSLGSSTS